MKFSEDELDALKARNPVDAVAGAWVRLRRRRGANGKGFTHVGPCPLCSRNPQAKDDSRFECGPDHWVCASCGEGGSVFHLLMKRDGIEFVAAVERLGGTKPEDLTPKSAERLGRQDHARGRELYPLPDGIAKLSDLTAAYLSGWNGAQRQTESTARYRERERTRLRKWWDCGQSIFDLSALDGLSPRNPVVIYLRNRGLLVPPHAKLRYHPDIPLFADGREDEPILVHRGPAMLAAIIIPDPSRTEPVIGPADGRTRWLDDGSGRTSCRFGGLHITWLDPNGPKGKIRAVHPDTGEILPSKKSRGSKQGGYIDLGGRAPELATAMVAGEGIETVLAVYTKLYQAGRDLGHTAFRCGIDLGNLGGRAIETVRHPTLKDAAGRARRVPGPDPDMSAPAMPVPDSVTDLVLLGDGDSDPFTTRCAITRAVKRHARTGRAVREVWAPDGKDFNDLNKT